MSSQTPDTAATPAAPKNRRGAMLRILLVVVILAAIACTVWYFMIGRWAESTDDAYVDGNLVQITPQTTGTVVSIGADNGDLVHAGDVLVKLDPSDADIALAQAKADLAGTVRKVRGYYSNVNGAKALVAAQQVALSRARDDFKRRQQLAATGAISREELAHARDELASVEAALSNSQQQLETSRVLVDDTVVASQPDVQAAAARLRNAYLADVRSTIVAPVTGYVAQRSVQLGQRVQTGAALMAVVPLHQVWVNANFKETQLTDMRLGQPVELSSDIYGSAVTYHGHIESLGIGTGSAFSLLPAQNATGNWIKIVQRIPVRVYFDDPRELDQHPLRIGLSMDAKVNLHQQSGALLPTQAPTEPVFATTVYQQQLAHVDQLVQDIIHANMAEGSGR
ncbi:HlyD family efflux transporter periplasmic adaptor subunit [Frateuria aurantia]